MCWVVHIPFVRMIKFKFLAHLAVDHLADPVIPCKLFTPALADGLSMETNNNYYYYHMKHFQSLLIKIYHTKYVHERTTDETALFVMPLLSFLFDDSQPLGIIPP